MTDQLWITTKEASARYGEGTHTWRKRAHNGEIKAKFGKKMKLEVASIDAFMNNGLVGTVKEADILAKATQEANLAQARADKAEAENKEGEAKQEMAIRNAGMTVEELREKELALGETLLEMERLMGRMVEIKEAQKLIFGKPFEAEWIKLAHLIDKGLGQEEENTSEGVE